MAGTPADAVNSDSNMPAQDGFAITPSDSVSFSKPARSIYVGVTGDITLVTLLGTVLTFKAVPAGMVLPVWAARVNATATTATNLIGLR